MKENCFQHANIHTFCRMRCFEQFHRNKLCCSWEEARYQLGWRWGVSWNRLEGRVWSCGLVCDQWTSSLVVYLWIFFWLSNRYLWWLCGCLAKYINNRVSNLYIWNSGGVWIKLTLTLLYSWAWNLPGILVIFLTIFLLFNGLAAILCIYNRIIKTLTSNSI